MTRVVKLAHSVHVRIHRLFCSVNDLGIGICSAVSKHYTCLYLSTRLKQRERRRKWVEAQMVLFRRYLR